MKIRVCGIRVLAVSLILAAIFVSRVASSDLPLKLLGTIIEPDLEKSAAVIVNQLSHKQGVYKVSDKVIDYQIVKIARGKVTFLKDAKLYVLSFVLGSEAAPVIAVSDDKMIINRQALLKKIPDLITALQQAIPLPHIEKGKIIGLKLTHFKDKELAKSVGIKEGDVLTKINGAKIDSITNALNVYQQVKNQDKIQVEIKRGAKSQSLTYYIN